jgi:Tfp pilus assembly protein PilF
MRYLLPLGIVLITLCAYLPLAQNRFVEWDDNMNFTQNANYRGLGPKQLSWMFTTFYGTVYQPLAWATLGLDYLLWELNPTGYLFHNLALHLGTTLLLYFIALRLLRSAISIRDQGGLVPWDRYYAALAALIWAVHPLRVEAVAWASNRSYVLPGLFFAAALLMYLRACDAGAYDRRRLFRFAGAASLFACSLLSKAIGLGFPLLLLLLDVYPLRRLGGRRGWWNKQTRPVWLEKLPFLLLAIPFALISLAAKARYGSLASMTHFDLSERFAQAAFGTMLYLYKTLVPVPLSPFYLQRGRYPSGPEGALLFGSIAAVLILASLLLRKRFPGLLAGWIGYLILLGPVAGIARYGNQVASDKWTYLACMGWPIVAAGGMHRVRSPWAIAAGVAIVLGLGVGTGRQVLVWRDTMGLWSHTLRMEPTCDLAHVGRGTAMEKGKEARKERAMQHYRHALKIAPDNGAAHNNLGLALALEGRADEALTHLYRSLGIKAKPELHCNIARLLESGGDREGSRRHYEEAVRMYGEALEKDPEAMEPLKGAAVAWAQLGAFGKAEELFRKAIAQERAPYLLLNLAATLEQQGKFEEASRVYIEGLSLAEQRKASHLTAIFRQRLSQLQR